MAWSVPPLNPLHVFEVASRVGSFTKAAEILSVSPSAVSRQIAALEAFLDVRLFNRSRDGNVLTEVGQEYYREIAPAFETISSVTDRIKRAHDSAPLTVRVTSTFAVRFLIPRLSEFRKEFPSVNVRIVTGFGAVDFVREAVDLSIQVGSGDWPGTEGQKLFARWTEPMCSPKLLKNGQSIRTIDDLLGHRLLVSNNRPQDWSDWLRAIGRSDFPLEKMELVEFPNSMLAFQAAVDGVGIVMGDLPVLNFAEQNLIRLFEKPIAQGAYYAVWRAESGPSRKARQFLSWLQKQLAPVLAELHTDSAA